MSERIQSATQKRSCALVRIAGAVFGCVVLALIVGAAYNWVAMRRYQSIYPPPGAIYSVEGYNVHLYCTGSGIPSVVLEGGLGETWIGWQQVQPELAKVTQVCSYDRAGLGRSDPQPGPRDSVHIAEQLHAALGVARVTGPLILVGQSAGGLYSRHFASKFPHNVVGLVLVDATPPESFDRIPGARESAAERGQRYRDAWVEALQDALGISRLRGRCRPVMRPALASYLGYALAEACRPRYDLSWLDEVDQFETSAREVAKTSFGALPVLVISQDPDRPKPGWSEREIAANPTWAAMQERLKMLSTRSRRIIASGSGHHVQNDRPDAVTSAVTEMINELRGTAPASTLDGTTVIQ